MDEVGGQRFDCLHCQLSPNWQHTTYDKCILAWTFSITYKAFYYEGAALEKELNIDRY